MMYPGDDFSLHGAFNCQSCVGTTTKNPLSSAGYGTDSSSSSLHEQYSAHGNISAVRHGTPFGTDRYSSWLSGALPPQAVWQTRRFSDSGYPLPVYGTEFGAITAHRSISSVRLHPYNHRLSNLAALCDYNQHAGAQDFIYSKVLQQFF